MSPNQTSQVLAAIEKVLNKAIPGTPSVVGRGGKATGNSGGRVMYVALPGSKKKTHLTHRAQQVLGQITRRKRATAATLQKALDVNRNVIAGAVAELKRVKLVGSEAFAGNAGMLESAAGHRPRKRNKK